jgi:DNA-binding response OmpR family regulator
MSHSVDAIVLDYELSLLQGAAVAAEMKKVKPQVPIVMLTDQLELTRYFEVRRRGRDKV